MDFDQKVLARYSECGRAQHDIGVSPGSVKSFSNVLSLRSPALGAHTLPQAEQGPNVVTKISEFFAIHPFSIFGAPSLKQGRSQIEAHGMRPVGRLIEIQCVLHPHSLFERENRFNVPSARFSDLG
jgi:hypothetical protein